MRRYPFIDAASEDRASEPPTAVPPVEALLPAAGAGTALWLMLTAFLLAV